MMKKINSLFVLLGLVIFLSGCNKSNNEINHISKGENTHNQVNNCLVVNNLNSWNLYFKAKVVLANTKNILSNNWGIVYYLNCQEWKQVSYKTLIAKITPDWKDPNVKNLVLQRKSLITQISNLDNIILSTKNNFANQLQSLLIQKKNIETQLDILTKNLEKLQEQKKYWVNDITSHLNTLQTQLNDLEKTKKKLEESKKVDLNKIQANIDNTIAQSLNLISDVLLKIDEIYGITSENLHKNDMFETYLSAKNLSLKQQIKNKFPVIDSTFNKIRNNPKEEDVVKLLSEIDNLVNLVKESVKASVSSRSLLQSLIDSWYNLFVQYDSSLVNLKNSLESLINSKQTVKNNYDTQILNLQTQINSVKNNIENLKKNKIGSYTSSIDIQINQTQSQIDNLKSNLNSIKNNINTLKDQENVQIKQLENQISQLKSNLKNIENSLATQYIYAWVQGTVKAKMVSVWNKVWPNSLLCVIVPTKSSLKLQLAVPEYVLKVGDYVNFFADWKNCKIKIISKLPYTDPITNYPIYETDTSANCGGTRVSLSNLFQEWKIITVKVNEMGSLSWDIFIPLDFVINKITGQKVKVYSGWKIIERNVLLWDIDWDKVKVLSGLKIGDKICK